MKKSVKKFLILSQVLGWSTLVASACTEEQVKTTIQNTITDSKSKDSTNTKTSDPSTQKTKGEQNTMTENKQTQSSTNDGQKTNSGNPQMPNGKLAPSAFEKDGKNMKSNKSQEMEHLNKGSQHEGATGQSGAKGGKTPEEIKKMEESQTHDQAGHTTGNKPGHMAEAAAQSEAEAKMHITHGEAGKNGNTDGSQTSHVDGVNPSSTNTTVGDKQGDSAASESPTDSEHDSGAGPAKKS